MTLSNCAIFAILFSSVFASITFKPCEEYTKHACQVKEVRVTPCEGVGKCSIRREHANITIAIDFIPHFDAQKMVNSVYSGPFYILESVDACAFTSCPVRANQTQTLTYYNISGTKLFDMLPETTSTIRWKTWNKENEKQVCCSDVTINKESYITFYSDEEIKEVEKKGGNVISKANPRDMLFSLNLLALLLVFK